ncbi:MAG: imelysin family protein [Hyphomicrobium sp.]|nr:imelysin family protein [Hyphomicrobium sp.]
MRVMAMLALVGISIASALLPATARAQSAAPPAFDHAGLARQALERHILPGYQHLAAATRSFDEAVMAYCRDTTAARRKGVDTAFDAVVSAWGRVEHIAFGPMAQHERLEKFMFWPDRRGIGARQVANALSKRDPDVLDVARLATKSVAMQGLPALDTLLFAKDEGSDPEARRHRCGFAAAVAANLARIAQSVSEEWADPNGFSKIWLSPGPDNRPYLTPSETTLALAKSFDQGLEKVRDQRLAGPLALNAQRRRLPAPLSNSGRSLLLVVANIEGLRDLYTEGGIEQAIVAANGDGPNAGGGALARLVANELATAHESLTPLVGARSPFDDNRSAQRIIAIGFPLKNARMTAASLLATAAGLPIGFNASDGD